MSNMGHDRFAEECKSNAENINGSTAAKHRRAFLMLRQADLRSATWGAD